MRLYFHLIEYLSIAEKALNTSVNNFLKDEILVIVTYLVDVSSNHVIEGHFPVIDALLQSFEMVKFSLTHVGIQNSFIYFASYRRWNTSFSILN